jgi:hypothetical protein
MSLLGLLVVVLLIFLTMGGSVCSVIREDTGRDRCRAGQHEWYLSFDVERILNAHVWIVPFTSTRELARVLCSRASQPKIMEGVNAQ